MKRIDSEERPAVRVAWYSGLLLAVALLMALAALAMLLGEGGRGRSYFENTSALENAGEARISPEWSAAERMWGDLGRPVSGMAGEFEPQAALLLACDELVEEHAQTFADLVAAAHRHIKLVGLVSSNMVRLRSEELLAESGIPKGAVAFVQVPQQTVWIRDYGPLFVRTEGGGAAVVDSDRSARCSTGDETVPTEIARILRVPRIISPLAVEGGNLLTNGEGLCVTTSAIVNGDAPTSRETVADSLRDEFGFARWVHLRPPQWVETEHVDMFMAFLAPDVVVVSRAVSGVDPENALALDAAAEQLSREKTSRGPMKVWRVPLGNCSDGVFRTYTNIIIANDVVLVPVYPNDDLKVRKEVLDLYSRLMPGRKVVGIFAESLIQHGGALRCMSMNVPTFVKLPRAGFEWVSPRCELDNGAVDLRVGAGPHNGYQPVKAVPRCGAVDERCGL